MNARRHQIVSHCRPHLQTSGYRTKYPIVRLDDYAIKFGVVEAGEVNTQRHAWESLDPRFGFVPEVYDYFSWEGVDYLVMEFVEADGGTGLDDAAIEAIAKLVIHMHTLTGDRVGPVHGGGKCRGTLWPDGEEILVESLSHLETIINSRAMMSTQDRACFTGSPLVLVHGDLAPRNIILARKGICLIDWEYGGFLPRSAEITVLYQNHGVNGRDIIFRDNLLGAIFKEQPLDAVEDQQVDSWSLFVFNCTRYSW